MLTPVGEYGIIHIVVSDTEQTTLKCASGSAVEHLLAKEGVAGSIPVSRSFLFPGKPRDFVFCVTFRRNETIFGM